MITIERNDYVQPTEVREEVVKGICEAFLNNSVWSIYHPFSASAYRPKTPFIVRHKSSEKFFGFSQDCSSDEIAVRFNGAEMKAAFSVLRDAGYHIWKVSRYGVWKGYVVTKKPCCENYRGGVEVDGFYDFID